MHIRSMVSPRRFSSRRLVSLIGCLACAHATALAQDATQNEAPKQSQMPAAVAMEKGEVRLDGKITAMLGPESFDIAAIAYGTPSGKTVEFDAPKNKSIVWSEATKFQAREDAKRTLNARTLKLGVFVSVIGRDKGAGTPLQARLVLVWGVTDSNVRQYGGKPMNRVTAILQYQADAAKKAKNYEVAAKLLNQAVGTAQGANDATGTATSYNALGLLYSEMQQSQKSVQAFEAGIKVAGTAGETYDEAILLNNLAMHYSKAKQIDKAVPLLEQSLDRMEKSGNTAAMPTLLGNLAGAYGRNNQLDKALQTFRRALPLVIQENIPEDVVESHVGIGLSVPLPAGREEATTMLTRALAKLPEIADDKKRAVSMIEVAKLHARLGETDKAEAMLKQALAIFQQTGDNDRAAEAQRELDALKNPQPAAPATPVPTTPAPAAPPAAAPAPPVAE